MKYARFIVWVFNESRKEFMMSKIFDDCFDVTIKALQKDGLIKEVDAKEYKNIKLSAFMKFKVDQYEVKDFGNMSVMRLNMGLMKMLTVVFSPFKKDMPLLSLDFMIVGGVRKYYAEFYELIDDKNEMHKEWLGKYNAIITKYSDLQSFSAKEAWYESLLCSVAYKQFKSGQDLRFMEFYTELLGKYIEAIKTYPLIEEGRLAEKKRLIKEYSDNLINKGGISTDTFKKKLGAEKTRDFFDKVFFGARIY